VRDSVLKTGGPKGLGGSNPSASALEKIRMVRKLIANESPVKRLRVRSSLSPLRRDLHIVS
jgi:hypothetical protein